MGNEKGLTGDTKEARHLGCGGRIVNHMTRPGEEQCMACGVAGRPLQRMRSAGVRPLEALTLDAVDAAVMTARLKFPGNRFMLAALTEEVGELARALLQKQGRDAIEREALQVAAVALRIVEEGDASFADITDAESKS